MIEPAKFERPAAAVSPASKTAPPPKEPAGLGCLVIVARHYGLHLSVAQLIHDNVLTKSEISIPEIVRCAMGQASRQKR